MRHALLSLILLAAPLPLAAQDLPEPDALLSGAADAAERLRDAAEDRLTLADSLGAEVIGPDGESIGTVEDFVALPGGNLVAAVIAREGGDRIALPWDIVQAGLAAGSEIEIPMTGSELDGAEALQDLSDALDL
ncbi:PRC-barrel domain-containing protein [Jannaschia formosa]|uniref:PRC-barrel domain-containing protein n=1 Tax=Jannaschia formosa TaxID=2259592 RepID=UPI000E1B64D4|nr:PRC-barrel domain-containing protein [Jannaschia formosa]TFL20123.1 PRC-barrel domain containing protein [Jannaschia formosa]